MSEEIWRNRMCSRLTGCYTVNSPATPPLTLRDVESFAPAPSAFRSEPDGWAIAGLPTNFLADRPPVIVGANVLGVPLQVRFTPVAFAWDYGDGTTQVSGSSGQPWTREFTATPTSHVYAASGSFAPRLTTRYEAAYRVDGDWLELSGLVSRESAPLRVLVVTARTALTDPCPAEGAAC